MQAGVPWKADEATEVRTTPAAVPPGPEVA